MSLTQVVLEVSSPEQEALLRHYHGLLLEMEQLALAAPDGQVLDLCEAAVVERGQEANRRLLEQVVQRRVDAAEKKGRRCGPAPAASFAKTAAQARDGSSVASGRSA